MIKLKRILHEAGIISEQDESFEFEFNSGESTLSNPGNVELSQLIARVNNMIKRGSKIKSIKIIASESKVTNQRPYEEEGSLAKARSENLAAIIKKEFPNIEVKATYQPKAQGPEYDKNAGDRADDPKYKKYQYVRAVIELKPPETIEVPTPLHRIALGFSGSNITFFCMENLKNYEDTNVNEILGYVDKNIEKLSTAEGNELQYLDSYQWMRDNLTGKMRDSYSTAIYGSVISPKSPRSKPLVDLLKKYGATQSTINPKTKIRLEDTTAKHAWFIYDERQIVNFFQQVSRDELDQIKDQTRK